MKKLKKIVFFLLCFGFFLSSCKKDEIIVRTNGEKNAEELQKIINNDKDPSNLKILVEGGGGGVLTDAEYISFENQYMVYFYIGSGSKYYHDLNNMLYFEYEVRQDQPNLLTIYF